MGGGLLRSEDLVWLRQYAWGGGVNAGPRRRVSRRLQPGDDCPYLGFVGGVVLVGELATWFYNNVKFDFFICDSCRTHDPRTLGICKIKVYLNPDVQIVGHLAVQQQIDSDTLIARGLVCRGIMTLKVSSSSPKPVLSVTPAVASSGARIRSLPAKALTVNVPIAVLNLAKTRASLDGTTLSAVVAAALDSYAGGLQEVLTKLGLGNSDR